MLLFVLCIDNDYFCNNYPINAQSSYTKVVHSLVIYYKLVMWRNLIHSCHHIPFMV